MRLILFTGKGGAGTSTVAAGTAVRAARSGVKTLLATLGDGCGASSVLQHPLGADPAEVEPGLAAAALGASPLRAWTPVRDLLGDVLTTLQVDQPPGSAVPLWPGPTHLGALLALRAQVLEGPWDLLVLDAGTVAELTAALVLPAAVEQLVAATLPVERRLTRAVAFGRAGTGADRLSEAAGRLVAELRSVEAELTGPRTGVRVVSAGDRLSRAEARRGWAALTLLGLSVEAEVRNGWPPEQAPDTRPGPEPMWLPRVPEPEGPVGLEALARLAGRLWPAREPAAELQPVMTPLTPRVEADGEGFRLLIAAPGLSPEEVELTRVGDRLVVAAVGVRRDLTLPSVLRRCQVTGARLRDGELAVSFRPDPLLWRPL